MAPLEDVTAIVARVLAARPDVLEGYVFGSLARNEAQPHSDVDVAVFLQTEGPSVGFGADAEIAADLMAALGTNAVDVVVLNDAGPLLYHRVLRDGVRVLARDLRKTTTREGRALSSYCDYLPQLAKIRAATERRRQRGSFGQ